jgi:hypothetical protein
MLVVFAKSGLHPTPEQCRWTSPEMMARYDRKSGHQRDQVGSVLAELVDKAKS